MDLLDISCKKASRLISESQDHRLAADQQLQLNIHLKVCDACQYTAGQFASLKNIFAQYAKLVIQIPPGETPAVLTTEARTKMKAKLQS